MQPKFHRGSRVRDLLDHKYIRAGTVTSVFKYPEGPPSYHVTWDDNMWMGYWWGEEQLVPLLSQELADEAKISAR